MAREENGTAAEAPPELHRAQRPTTFDEVHGQEKAVTLLRTHLGNGTMPHALLFAGGSGCGKTTLARIAARELGCGRHGLYEMNTADFRGVETAREVRKRMGYASLGGDRARVYILDEVHQTTKEFQSALLKTMEEPPAHVYFMLCTTDPHKLLVTIRTRCTPVEVAPLSGDALKECVAQHLRRARREPLPDEVLEKLAEVAGGSAREAVKLADMVKDYSGAEAMLEAIESGTLRKAAIDLAKALFEFPRPTWRRVAVVLKALDEDAESVRHLVLGYARSVLLGGGKSAPRAAVVIRSFRGHFYDGKAADLAMACWEVVHDQG